MKKKPLKLTISFGKKYEGVFHYLSTKENTSRYICELISREMKNDNKEENLEDKVYKILQEYLESEQIVLNTNNKPPNQTLSNSKLMDEEIELLDDLFG